MARLIDADELMKKFYDIEFNAKHELFGESRDLALEGLKHIKKALKGMPTIDPVKHGHWVFTGRTYKCSNCCLKEDNAVEADLCDMPLLNFKYCPNCGAKMDGDAND